jgi:hypothetical protein
VIQGGSRPWVGWWGVGSASPEILTCLPCQVTIGSDTTVGELKQRVVQRYTDLAAKVGAGSPLPNLHKDTISVAAAFPVVLTPPVVHTGRRWTRFASACSRWAGSLPRAPAALTATPSCCHRRCLRGCADAENATNIEMVARWWSTSQRIVSSRLCYSGGLNGALPSRSPSCER